MSLDLKNNIAFQGELFTFFEAILWSLFFVFPKISVTALKPFYGLGLSSLFAAFFFATVITVKKQWSQITVRTAWKNILWATISIGIIFYCLLFIGLQKTTAGNGSIIALMEVFFSMMILGFWKKENLRAQQKFGAVLMVIGAVIVLFPGRIQFNGGDVIILIATAIPPLGNYFAQKAMKQVGSMMIMFIRSLLAGLTILFLAIIIEPVPTSKDMVNSILFVLLNGFIVLGLSKVLWLEAIHRIPITKAVSLGAIAPAFTLLFAFLLLGERPNYWQFFGLLPMLLGIVFLTEYIKLSSNRLSGSNLN